MTDAEKHFAECMENKKNKARLLDGCSIYEDGHAVHCPGYWDSMPGTDKEKQLLALQERFRVPVCLVSIEESGCGSYLYYADDRDPADPDKGLIGYVPEGSEGGFYGECCCSGLTGDPKGLYCKGECHCGACDDHHDDGWQPGLRPGDRG